MASIFRPNGVGTASACGRLLSETFKTCQLSHDAVAYAYFFLSEKFVAVLTIVVELTFTAVSKYYFTV